MSFNHSMNSPYDPQYYGIWGHQAYAINKNSNNIFIVSSTSKSSILSNDYIITLARHLSKIEDSSLKEKIDNGMTFDQLFKLYPHDSLGKGSYPDTSLLKETVFIHDSNTFFSLLLATTIFQASNIAKVCDNTTS